MRGAVAQSPARGSQPGARTHSAHSAAVLTHTCDTDRVSDFSLHARLGRRSRGVHTNSANEKDTQNKNRTHYNTILRDSENVQNDSLTISRHTRRTISRPAYLPQLCSRSSSTVSPRLRERQLWASRARQVRPSAMCRAAARSLRRTAAPSCATSWLPERLLRLLVLSHKQGQRLLERRLALAWLR